MAHTSQARALYALELKRACEDGDLLRVRLIFREAAAELPSLHCLMAYEDEVTLAQCLRPKYDSGASLRALAREIGRTHNYVSRLLTRIGVEIRPPGRHAQAPRVDLAALRGRYDEGTPVEELASEIHYSREMTRRFLRRAGATLRRSHPKRMPAPQGAVRHALALSYKERYELDGMTARAIAKQAGRSEGLVYRLLKEAETTMRPRGSAGTGAPNSVTRRSTDG